ncbi:MAG: hypothetical protein M3408_06220 [Actinomycetota bacterium]|nr:hypothetical protein [Actinomycetota bacterium]
MPTTTLPAGTTPRETCWCRRRSGAVVFEGPPSALVTAVGSVTGEHLARYLGAAPVAR